ncbi:putative E3 ubiquitin-protein ligase SINA-like 6 [Prunus yedoensis var. nudiflora]|uniref:Putative E3 ubiquitin-protein ligase SINA-like 6 n=1 Tax=Prunus yedoensis var. nudiflora TaxID=2094558 RepID=A0A314YSH1_PRUYE|nr:putative E3 ubiquitin-protein ligase SINA-like 6 [Prunus yedoensis var. nudiflora]
MARFALGGDEDGEGEGSRIPRPKKPRLAPNLLPQYPAARIAIIEQQPPQPPQPQSQQLRTVEEDEEADEESEGEEEESESEVEADEESEEEDEDEEEDEEGEEEITVGFEQQVGNSYHIRVPRTIDRFNRPVRLLGQNRTAQANPQVGSTSASLTSNAGVQEGGPPPISTVTDELLVRLCVQNRTAQANPQVGSASASLTSNAGVQEGGPPPISPVTDGSLVFTLADPEVLDCLICYEPLTIPVFQCENGHIACSSCCTKSKNKCPSCSMPIGYNRCRAIEKILESIRISCQNIKHGCKEMAATLSLQASSYTYTSLSGKLNMDLCIWHNDRCPASFQSIGVA